MKLTATQVKNAKPGAKTTRLFDGRGLYLEVTAKGGKYWRLKYRFANKEKRIALGVYPDVSLAQARERCNEKRRLVADGIDPSQDRKRRKIEAANAGRNKLSEIASDWFEANTRSWAESHSKKVKGRISYYLKGPIGDTPIEDITAPDLLRLIRVIEQTGKIETANRVLRMCGQIFRFAIQEGRATEDITQSLRGVIAPSQKKHMAAVTDPVQFGALLRAIDGFQGTLIVQCALRLAPLVFVRPGELRSAEWKGIDFENAEWRFMASKTNSHHIVPLSKQAIEILADIQQLTGEGRFIFPNARTTKKPMSEVALLAALRRMGIEKSETSVHGFRATARTLLDEQLGFRADYIEHQLAHAVRDPNGRAYNRTKFLPERRKMMQAWADYLDTLKFSSNVVSFGKQSSY